VILVVAVLIALHGPDGHDITVNMEEITSVHCRYQGSKSGSFAPGANAIINMTDGKFVSIRETCEELKKILTEAEKKR
jgi:hypothetical protein